MVTKPLIPNPKIAQGKGIYLFNVNNRNSRTMCEICLKLTIKWRRSGVFIANFEQISRIVLVFLLLTLNKYKNARKCI